MIEFVTAMTLGSTVLGLSCIWCLYIVYYSPKIHGKSRGTCPGCVKNYSRGKRWR